MTVCLLGAGVGYNEVGEGPGSYEVRLGYLEGKCQDMVNRLSNRNTRANIRVQREGKCDKTLTVVI